MNDSLSLLSLREFSFYISKCQSKLNEILEVLIVFLVIFILLNLVLYLIINRSLDGRNTFRLFRRNKLPSNISRVLLVTAHPDDEAMFFGPTLIALGKRANCRVFVLCLSQGNYDKKGHLRKNELWSSCKELKVNPQDVTLMDCTLLPDDPTIEWKVEVVSSLIQHHVETLDIDLLITFDKGGVSDHKNHQAIYYATASLCLSGLIPTTCRVLVLDTVNVVRKYFYFFDVFISLLLSTNWAILLWRERKIVKSAMYKHRSQMLWFRKLYINVSRYMLINSLTELNLESIEFDILES